MTFYKFIAVISFFSLTLCSTQTNEKSWIHLSVEFFANYQNMTLDEIQIQLDCLQKQVFTHKHHETKGGKADIEKEKLALVASFSDMKESQNLSVIISHPFFTLIKPNETCIHHDWLVENMTPLSLKSIHNSHRIDISVLEKTPEFLSWLTDMQFLMISTESLEKFVATGKAIPKKTAERLQPLRTKIGDKLMAEKKAKRIGIKELKAIIGLLTDESYSSSSDINVKALDFVASYSLLLKEAGEYQEVYSEQLINGLKVLLKRWEEEQQQSDLAATT